MIASVRHGSCEVIVPTALQRGKKQGHPLRKLRQHDVDAAERWFLQIGGWKKQL